MANRPDGGSPLSQIALASLLVAVLIMMSPLAGAQESLVLTGAGVAVIDGVMSPQEWDHAASFDFQASLPLADGGGTIPTTLFVMNDGVNLYLGVRVMRQQLNTGSIGFGLDQVAFEFDNDNDGGVTEDGDDVLLLSPGLSFSGLSNFYDEVRTIRPPCPSGIGFCGLLDIQLIAPGTNDGAGAATNNGVFSFFEISHPLDSADDLNDFSLAPGSTVGFFLLVNLSSEHAFCESNCSAGTPSPLPGPGGGSDILIGSPTILSVDLDIIPGSDATSIIPGHSRNLPVAILSSPAFDAFADVDVASLTFGRTGDEVSLNFCHSHPVDVNHDGRGDLVCNFDVRTTGLESGDATANLKGQTVDGVPLQGKAVVLIVP